MARLGRLFGTLTKPNGDPAIGVTVAVRRQGANITANQSVTSGNPITVDDPGGIRVSDTVQVNGTGTGYNVSAIAATTVTLNGYAGTLDLVTGDQLIPSNSVPTLYSDRQGVNSFTPLRTNGFGEYEAFLDGGEYVLVTSGGGYADRVFRDVYVSSPRMVFNIFDSATAKAFIVGVKNALSVAGAKLLSLQNPDGVEAFSIAFDGTFTITGGITAAMLAANSVTTVKIVDANVTTAKIADGAITGAKIASNAVHVTPVKTNSVSGSSSVAVTIAEVDRVTVAYTPAANNIGIRVSVNIPYDVVLASNEAVDVEARLYINGVLKTKGWHGGTNVGGAGTMKNDGTISFVWFEPAVASGAPLTFKVADIKSGAPTANYRGDIYVGYMLIEEMLK